VQQEGTACLFPLSIQNRKHAGCPLFEGRLKSAPPGIGQSPGAGFSLPNAAEGRAFKKRRAAQPRHFTQHPTLNIRRSAFGDLYNLLQRTAAVWTLIRVGQGVSPASCPYARIPKKVTAFSAGSCLCFAHLAALGIVASKSGDSPAGHGWPSLRDSGSGAGPFESVGRCG
jgi:hypothetical protein